MDISGHKVMENDGKHHIGKKLILTISMVMKGVVIQAPNIQKVHI